HGSLSTTGLALINRLAAMAGATAADIIRPATFSLQIGNGMILENARGIKQRTAIGSRKVRRSNPALNATPAPSDDDESTEKGKPVEPTAADEKPFCEDEVRSITPLLCTAPAVYDATRPNETRQTQPATPSPVRPESA